MSEATLTHEVSSTRLPTHKLNKENTKVAEWGGKVRWPGGLTLNKELRTTGN